MGNWLVTLTFAGVLATAPVAATAQAIVYSTYLGGSNNEGEQPLVAAPWRWPSTVPGIAT